MFMDFVEMRCGKVLIGNWRKGIAEIAKIW